MGGRGRGRVSAWPARPMRHSVGRPRRLPSPARVEGTASSRTWRSMPRKSVWLGLLLTVVFLWLAFRGIDLAELGGALGRADYAMVVPALLATTGGYLLRALRWQVIVASEARVRYPRALSVLT